MNLFILFSLITAVISVSASQSPVITIASRGSPNRSEIRFSSSPNPAKSTFKEILISRPDSPSISINRQGIKAPSINYSNGNDSAFHISLGTPTTNNQREISLSSPLPTSMHMLGRTSPVTISDKFRKKNKTPRHIFFSFSQCVQLKFIMILRLIHDMHQI